MAPSERLAEGTVIDGRYVVTGFIGAGGFARVYRARHVHIQREVALKVLNLPSDLRDRDRWEQRFIQEGRLAGRIDHPGVVGVHDLGFHGEERQPYIAMELLRGHDLQAELDQNGPLAPIRAVRLLLQTLDAVAAAHQLGVVHKDLKPANLFLVDPGTADERIKVVDFGVARVADDSRLTATGQVFGTVRYLAPEYIRHQLVTPALDVYQLGLILVELLTGEAVVHDENSLRCVLIHSSGELEIPEEVLSGPLGPLVVKALALDHTERFPDAAAFAEALKGVDPSRLRPLERRSVRRALSTVSAGGRAVATGPGGESGELAVRESGEQSGAVERVKVPHGPDEAQAEARPSAVAAPVRPATPASGVAATMALPTSSPPASRAWLVLVGAGVLGAGALVGLVVVGLALVGQRDRPAVERMTVEAAPQPDRVAAAPEREPAEGTPASVGVSPSPSPRVAPSFAPPADDALRDRLADAVAAFQRHDDDAVVTGLEPLTLDDDDRRARIDTLPVDQRLAIFGMLLVVLAERDDGQAAQEVGRRALEVSPAFALPDGATTPAKALLADLRQERDRPTDPVVVQLDTSPTGAALLSDEVLVGTSPITWVFSSRQAEALVLVARKDGFAPKRVELQPTPGQILVHLEVPSHERPVGRPVAAPTPRRERKPTPPATALPARIGEKL